MKRRAFVQTTAAILTAGEMGLIAKDLPAKAKEKDTPVIRILDSETYSKERIQSVHQSLLFHAKNEAEGHEWQKKAHKKLIELLGGFPEKTELFPEIKEKKEFDTYTREEVYFQSRENLTVKGYLLLPKAIKPPYRCMICLPGHGRGVDDIIGIKEDGTLRKEYGEYQNDFALQCVDNGLAAFAVEQFCFGARRDEHARKAGAGDSSCDPTAGIALMLGESMVGWRVWDVIRSVDYLETRTEINPNRIGAMGISGGGTSTLWSACVEPRIKVAFVSGYFCTFDRCIMAVKHCIDNYIPGIYKLADMPEFAGLIAPRPFFVESGTKDDIFLLDGVQKAVNRATEIYKVFHAEDKIGSEHFEAAHSFYGKAAFEFIKKWL